MTNYSPVMQKRHQTFPIDIYPQLTKLDWFNVLNFELRLVISEIESLVNGITKFNKEYKLSQKDYDFMLDYVRTHKIRFSDAVRLEIVEGSENHVCLSISVWGARASLKFILQESNRIN